jgi:hypothetical protein
MLINLCKVNFTIINIDTVRLNSLPFIDYAKYYVSYMFFYIIHHCGAIEELDGPAVSVQSWKLSNVGWSSDG